MADEFVQCTTASGAAQFFAEAWHTEQLCYGRQNIEVLLMCLFWDQQRKQQVDRHVVGGIEGNRLLETDENADRCRAAAHTAVGNGNAASHRGAAELLSGDKPVENIVIGH